MVCSIVLAGVAVAPNARAECSRKTLQKLADTHVMAHSTGDATRLRLAKGASYAENDIAMDVRQGVLAGPLKVDFTRSFYDTTPCATFTEVVAATDPHPYGIHTRIEATLDGKNVSKSESVVTDAGDRVFGAAKYLATTRIEQSDEIPMDKRDAYGHPGGGRRVPGHLGEPGQPDVSGRGRQESLHPRGDGLHDARLREREAAGTGGTGGTGTGGGGGHIVSTDVRSARISAGALSVIIRSAGGCLRSAP
jgi:hypothetical protein